LTRSLGFLELFSNSPLSIFGHLSWGPASRLAITRTNWSEWTRAWWPLELVCPSQESELNGLESASPPWLLTNSPLRVF
jgi:hypothetical protein